MNYIKIRNLCSTKHTLKRVEKGKPMNRRGCHQKAFLYANLVRTKKSRKNQNGQANKPTGKRHEKALHTHTCTHRVYKCPVETCSISSVMREKKTKIMSTTPPSTWLKLRSHTIPSVGKDVEHLELSHSAGPSVNWVSHYGKLAGSAEVEYG